MQRRTFLASLGGALVASTTRVDWALAAPGDPSPILWVHVQGTGGWDQALFMDPKPSVRGRASNAEREVRMAGNIPYLAFADLGGAAEDGFFVRHAGRMLVFNGVDTGTNNHTVGEAYSAAGSTVPDYPCWAAQIASVYGGGQPMPFISYGGYDRTGGLLAPARIPQGSAGYLRQLGVPSRDGSDQPFLSDASADLVRAAHRRRLLRQISRARLPDQKRALEALLAARDSEAKLGKVVVPGYDPNVSATIQDFKLALSAFKVGLTASVGMTSGSFDTHDDNENGQREALEVLFDTLGKVIELTEAADVPCVVLASSDFGRTPHYTGSGTDHHPVSSMMVLVNEPAQALSLPLPLGRVIGATTDGDESSALRAVKVDPATLALDDTGVTLTPGHVLRALRRVAGIAEAPELASFPLTVGEDLSLG